MMIQFNLGDADPSIVPSMSRALCRAICLRLLLGRALAYEISRWCGLPALASYFSQYRLVLILSTPEG